MSRLTRRLFGDIFTPGAEPPPPSGETFIPNALLPKLYGVYGQRRLVEGYNGALIRLALNSAPATQQDFLPQTDGTLDTAAILSFCANNQTDLRVVTRYDQTGNGNHLTQATAANRPAFQRDYADSEWVVLPGVQVYKAANTGTTSDTYLDTSSGVSGTLNNLSAIDVCECITFNQTVTQIFPELLKRQFHLADVNLFGTFNSPTRVNAVSPEAATIQRNIFYVSGVSRICAPNTQAPNTRYTWMHMRSNATNLSMNLQGKTVTATATAATAWTNYREGTSRGTNRSRNASLMSVVGQALSSTEASDILNAVLPKYAIPTATPTRQLIVDGDSISAGFTSGALIDEAYYSWLYTVANDPAIKSTTVIHNRAFSSGHINSTAFGGVQFREMLPVVDDKIAYLYDATTYPNGQVVVAFAGTNDLSLRTGVPGDATAVHADYTSYCSYLRGLGFKVIAVDLIPKQNMTTGQNTERLAFNSLVASNWSTYADAFVQLSALDWLPGGDANFYYMDSTHPNAAGRQLIANAMTPVIKAQLGL